MLMKTHFCGGRTTLTNTLPWQFWSKRTFPFVQPFPTAGDIHTAQRSCLKPEHVDKLIFTKKTWNQLIVRILKHFHDLFRETRGCRKAEVTLLLDYLHFDIFLVLRLVKYLVFLPTVPILRGSENVFFKYCVEVLVE